MPVEGDELVDDGQPLKIVIEDLLLIEANAEDDWDLWNILPPGTRDLQSNIDRISGQFKKKSFVGLEWVLWPLAPSVRLIQDETLSKNFVRLDYD